LPSLNDEFPVEGLAAFRTLTFLPESFEGIPATGAQEDLVTPKHAVHAYRPDAHKDQCNDREENRRTEQRTQFRSKLRPHEQDYKHDQVHAKAAREDQHDRAERNIVRPNVPAE